MICPASGKEDCEVCNNMMPYKEYLYKGFKDFVRWKEIRFWIYVIIIFILIFGWWGILWGQIAWMLMACNANGGFLIRTFDLPEDIIGKPKTFYCSICQKEETYYVKEKQ